MSMYKVDRATANDLINLGGGYSLHINQVGVKGTKSAPQRYLDGNIIFNNTPVCQFKARVTQSQVMLEDHISSSLDNIIVSNVNNIKTSAKDVIIINPIVLVNIVKKYWY